MGKISKGHNSVKNVDGVIVLVLCTSSDDGLYLYKVSENILNCIKLYRADKIFIGKISNGHNSVKK